MGGGMGLKGGESEKVNCMFRKFHSYIIVFSV